MSLQDQKEPKQNPLHFSYPSLKLFLQYWRNYIISLGHGFMFCNVLGLNIHNPISIVCVYQLCSVRSLFPVLETARTKTKNTGKTCPNHSPKMPESTEGCRESSAETCLLHGGVLRASWQFWSFPSLAPLTRHCWVPAGEDTCVFHGKG